MRQIIRRANPANCNAGLTHPLTLKLSMLGTRLMERTSVDYLIAAKSRWVSAPYKQLVVK